MSNVAVHPSTLEGIKRFAKTIKREQEVSHSRALDVAAQAAGYQNFRHARHRLATAIGAASLGGAYDIYVTAYWRDKQGRSGRETLRVALAKPLIEFGNRRTVTRTRGTLRFRVDADDHLEYIHDIKDQASARDVVCNAVRTLAFMDASGLVPATSRQHNVYRHTNGMPARDHRGEWFHPASGMEVVSDEPYCDPDLLQERTQWLSQRGLHIRTPDWPGMHAPRQATLFLVAEDEQLLDDISRRVEQIHIQALPSTWEGESADYAPLFVSPARHLAGIRKRARPKPIVAGEERNGALPYRMLPWGKAEWRPKGKMPIKAHAEVASLLKTLVLLHPAPARTMSSISVVRCELDEWLQREYSRSVLPDEKFRELYYGRADEALPTGLSARGAVSRVKSLLTKHYGDCAPLRSVIRRLTTAERHMRS